MREKRSFGENLLSFIGCLGPFAAFLLIQNFIAFAIMIAIMIPILLGAGADFNEQQLMQVVNGMTSYLLFICTVATSVTGYLWYKYAYKDEFDYDVRKVAKGRDYAYIVGMAFVFTFVTNILIAIVCVIFPNALSNYNDLMTESGMGANILTFLTAAFIAPIGEECFYRGIIQRKAERFLPFIWANILQAALFGIMHMNIIQGVYAFALGLLMGYVHHKYQTLAMPVLLHMTFNIFGQTVPLAFAKLPGAFANLIIAASVVVLVILIRKVSEVSVPPKQQRMGNFC